MYDSRSKLGPNDVRFDEHRGDTRVSRDLERTALSVGRHHDDGQVGRENRLEDRAASRRKHSDPRPAVHHRQPTAVTYPIRHLASSRGGTVTPFGLTWEAPEVDKKPTVPDIIMMAGGAVCLLFSFFAFYEFGGSSESAWGSGLFPIATYVALFGLIVGGSVALMKFANVKMPEPILGFSWKQIRLALSIFAGLHHDRLPASSTRAVSTRASASG